MTLDIDAIEACIKNGAYHEMDLRALCAEVRELRAALGRLQGEVETIINTEPHEDVCLIGRGGDCTCWQSRLERALAGETK